MSRTSKARKEQLQRARTQKKELANAELLLQQSTSILALPEIGRMKAKRVSQKKLDAITHTYTSVNVRIRALSRRLSASTLELNVQRSETSRLSALLDTAREAEASLQQQVNLLMNSTRTKLQKSRQAQKRSAMQLLRVRRAAKINASKYERLLNDFNCLEDKNAGLENELRHQWAAGSTPEHKLAKAASTISELRNTLSSTRKCLVRAKENLSDTRKELNSLRLWKPTEHGCYTPGARSLSRQLMIAGVKPEKLRDVVLLCAEAFGITVEGDRFISARTGARAVKEGGLWGLMQIGRELTNAKAFGESSDGTSIGGITQESYHYTLSAPTYDPGVDDNDPKTWKQVTRFVEVRPAINHTGEEQVKGSIALGEKALVAYGNSLLCKREGNSIDLRDYFRKQIFQNLDHASDGKKKFRLIQIEKERLREEDLGQQAISVMDPEEICDLLVTLTDQEIMQEYKDFPLMSEKQKYDVCISILTRRVGKSLLDKLKSSRTLELTDNSEMFGCCAHKEMNAAKIGYNRLHGAWVLSGRTPPVLLPNKANAAAISLDSDGDAMNAATVRAMESSASGAEKLLQLCGALFCHKDGLTGYQLKHRFWMEKRKRERYGKDVKCSRYPNISAVRFQSLLYGASETFTYIDLYIELIEEICNGKVNPGANHVEANVLKGLRDLATLTEMAAMALYGEAVSKPYFAHVRGTDSDGNPLNFLDLTKFHRNIPIFCETIAANPSLLWDESAPLSKRTLRGEPFRDRELIHMVALTASELPDLEFAVSEMFRGCAEGWIHFTPEFAPGGPIDCLTAEHKKHIFVPTTNDHNEGSLGSLRIYTRMNPTSNAFIFSDINRIRTNNTENFIKKIATPEDHLSVMREVREREKAPPPIETFKEEYVKYQHDKSREQVERRAKIKIAREKELQRLKDIGLVIDTNAIAKMTKPQLYDQLKIHKQVLADPVLQDAAMSGWKRDEQFDALIAAVARYNERISKELGELGDTGSTGSECLPADQNDNVDQGQEAVMDVDILEDGPVDTDPPNTASIPTVGPLDSRNTASPPCIESSMVA